MPSLPFELAARPLHADLAPGERVTEDVLIRIDVTDLPGRVRPELAAVLVVDTSSSMSGVPIEQVRRGAVRLAEILGDGDSLGVVRFDDHAEVVSEIVGLGGDGRARLTRAIDGLTTRGSTNMSGGLARALMLFPPERGDRRFVILLMSDGQANIGVSTPEGLAAETASLKKRGVGTSTLGFGPHHHEDTLIAIADAGGGRYAFVSDPRLADAELARAIGAQRDIVAEDLQLIVRPAAGVEIVRVLGDPPTSFAADGLRVQLADAIAGDQINAVVELAIEPPDEIGPWRPLEIALSARPAGASESARMRGEVAVTLSRIDGGGGLDLEVARFAAIARAGEARDQARALADRGNFAGAAQLLREARDRVTEAPGFDRDAGGPLADVYETLTDDITAMENRPDPEAYAKYRKAQRGYSDFAAGGLKGRTQSALGGAAAAMASAAQDGPLPPARLIARRGAVEVGAFPLDRPDVIIGRGGDNEISVALPSLSRRHTRIKLVDGVFWVFDLGSTNGTRVNGELLAGGKALAGGDRIEYGDLELVYEEDESDKT